MLMNNRKEMQPSVCFQVQKIIGMSNGKGNLKNFQVQWAPTWVSSYHLVGCESLIEEFLKQQMGNDDTFDVSGSELNYSQDEDLIKYQDLATDGTIRSDDGVNIFDDATSDDGVDQESISHNPVVELKQSTLSNEETSLPLHGTTDSSSFFEVSSFSGDVVIPSIENTIRSVCSTPSTSLNPNFEWLQRNVKNIYDGGGEERVSISKGGGDFGKSQSDISKDGNTENPGKLSSFESTFAFARNRHRLNEFDQSKTLSSTSLPTKDVLNKDKQILLPSNMLDIKQEEMDLNVITSGISNTTVTNFVRTFDNTMTTSSVLTTGKDNSIFSYKENALLGSRLQPPQGSLSGPLLPQASGSSRMTAESQLDNIMTANIETQLKTFKCDLCEKEFKNNASLKRHVKIHATLNDAFRCKVCYRRFDNQAALEKHELIHNRERKYVCNICHKKFSENGNLQAHIRTHTGERPYKCSYCSKMFLTSSDLKRHLRVHTGERPYECKVCHKRFKINDHLQKHIRTHVEERPSMCDNL